MGTILTWVLVKSFWEVMEWIDVAQDSGQMAGCCEDGNETSGSKNMGISLTSLEIKLFRECSV